MSADTTVGPNARPSFNRCRVFLTPQPPAQFRLCRGGSIFGRLAGCWTSGASGLAWRRCLFFRPQTSGRVRSVYASSIQSVSGASTSSRWVTRTRLADWLSRPGHHPAHLRRAQGASQEDADLEAGAFGAHEEVARAPREHDRMVRRVDALVAERRCRFPQPLPGIAQILADIDGQCVLGGRPAVVRVPVLEPRLAVVALASSHVPIVAQVGRWQHDNGGPDPCVRGGSATCDGSGVERVVNAVRTGAWRFAEELHPRSFHTWVVLRCLRQREECEQGLFESGAQRHVGEVAVANALWAIDRENMSG